MELLRELFEQSLRSKTTDTDNVGRQGEQLLLLLLPLLLLCGSRISNIRFFRFYRRVQA